MVTPGTYKQAERLLELVGELNPTTDQLQNLFGAGDLLKQMAATDLSQVDRLSFAAVLDGTLKLPVPSIPWTPVKEYVERIMDRSEIRGWGLTKTQAAKLATQLATHDHAGPLTPTGVSIWLGKNLEYNRAEAIAWLEDEVKALGFSFTDHIGSGRTLFYPGSQVTSKRQIHAVSLDLGKFWNPTDGLIPRQVRAKDQQRWPGLEVFWLLALNPRVYVAMDGKIVPYMFAPGLVVDSDYLPRFDRNGRECYVDDHWDDSTWCKAALVAFREL